MTVDESPLEGMERAAPGADCIHRRYFLAGILIILTAGASWGVWLLWRIGVAGDFTAISIHHVNAHGHAQIFGWVGLFIMGFSSQAFPRFWRARMAAPQLNWAVFLLMLAGIVTRTLAMTLPGASWALTTAVGGGILEITAIAIFSAQLLATFLRSRARLEPYTAFAMTALGFFLVQALVSVWHMHAIMTAVTRDALIEQVATWQAPLRDLQIHGMALFMIIGVSLYMLPRLYAVPFIPHRRAWTAYALLLAGVLGEVAIFLAYRMTGSHALAALLMIPWLMLAAGSAMIALPWRPWRGLPAFDGAPDRSAKYLCAAWGWLAISLAMLLLLPVYQALSGIPFSHAYYGAIRHALTVGFISLMIMGHAAWAVPALAGVNRHTLPALWTPFLLVNTGCLLRVALQTLTDWHPVFFGLVGLSGVLEVTGLAIWGIHLARIMLGVYTRRFQPSPHAGRDPFLLSDSAPSP